VLKALNTTDEQADEEPSRIDSWWAILLFVIAGLIVRYFLFVGIDNG
jgi:hypothetical protein